MNADVFVFTIDPIAQRRFAAPVEPAQLRSISVDSVALWLYRSPRHLRCRDGYTAGEIDVILKSSIFIAGTSAVPGKS